MAPRTSRPRTPINPAAAALGVGIQPDKWQPEQIIEALTNRYTQLIQLAEEQKTRQRENRARLFYAGAFELSQILSAYYQDMGRTEEYLRWEHRRMMAQSGAYRAVNSVAEAIGTRIDPIPMTPPATTGRGTTTRRMSRPMTRSEPPSPKG